MKAISRSFSSDQITTTPTFFKIITLSLISISAFFAVKHFSDIYPLPQHLYFFPSFTTTTTAIVSTSSPSLVPQSQTSPWPPGEVVERTGIVDENGTMTEEFLIGEFDPSVTETVVKESSKKGRDCDQKRKTRVKVEKYRVCDESMREYIPCLDNVGAISRLNSAKRGEKYERHCPEKGRGLDCLVPRPKGYKLRVSWPKSRDEVWFDNILHTRVVENKGGQNWISRKEDKFIFPGGGTQFIHGTDQYLDQISKMVPDIAFGQHVRVALDVGCEVASFGALLLDRNVTTLSISPKDVHENQIQFALERGVPAMVAVFATHRLLYPSQAFDLIHCSRCRINWTRDDGILLLEVNRMLRAGGYFVWAAQPVYKHEENLQEQWKEMENLTGRICWELVKKEGYIAIWQKPLNNNCYIGRDPGAQPPMCDADDDPDNVWCEPFDTYPRTYDLLNAAGLFSVEQKRCSISTIMLEMDRILRPGGRVYIRDITSVIDEIRDIANLMGWVTFLFDTMEGPHASWKLLNCEKRL